MQSPYQSTPPRQQASSSLRTPSQHDLINAGCSNVRVVVRIRPFNTEEQRRGCKPTVYCLEESAVQQPPPDSPTGSITSVDSQSTTNSRQSFTLRGRRVLSKLRPFQHRRGKSNSTASSTVSIEPTPIINNSAKKRNVFAVTDDEATKQNGKYPKICCAANRQFEFDAVYCPAVTQEELYNHSFGESLAANLLEGYNTTIIAFGMTGAGKSYTMSDKDGVIYHSVHDIFHEKTAHTEKQVTVQMSCVEIYNEDLRDLLVDGEDSSSLKLRDNGDSVEVTGLHVVSVESLSEVRELLDFAQCRRTTGCTRLNERSSRSHAIYTLTVTTNNAVTAKLTLVDLAGSERIKETGVVGSQRKESIHINKELFVLGKVIASLQDRNCHVPYRDSKLTRLLRESLGGNCQTVLIACVSSADIYADESMNTLRYAERTRSITNSAKQNTLDANLTPAQCVALQAENKILKARIANLTRRNAMNDVSVFDSSRGMEFSGLEAKLQLAKEQAKATRDSCNAVASTAVRLKERYEKVMIKEMIDQCDFVEEGVAHHIYCLIQEKIALCGELITQCRELEPKRIELDLNSNSFGDSHSEHRLEATNTQGKIQILARSMEDNEKLLQSILGSLSGEPQLKDENDETQPLQDEHVNRHELEARCESLGHDIEFFNSENDILRHQNIRLQDEIQRLRSRLGPAEAQVDPVRSDVDEESESNDCEKAEEGSLPLEQRQIRSHAEQLLDWADRAIERGRNAQEDVCGSSIASSFATYLRPSLHSHSDEFFRHESWVSAANDGENHCLISNMTNIGHEGHCSCRNSIFSSNPELVDFYLPKLGVMCSCGRKEDVPLQGTDPCHLVNILRDWQVEFLGSLGLQTAVDLLHACAKTSKPLAKEMRMWRKENGLLSVRTKSCCIALRIWTRTCQAVIKAVRENEVGTIGRPEFLDVSLSSDTFTVSTLGFGGSFAEARKFSDVQ